MSEVTTAKVKKPFYKKWWVWVIVIFIIGAIATSGDDETVKDNSEKGEVSADEKPEVEKEKELTEEEKEAAEAKAKEESEAAELKEKEDAETKAKEESEAAELKEKEDAETKAKAEAKKKEESIPREHKSALKKAETYAETMHMSKAGIYDQLTSEYGEGFPPEAAQYAIDNIVTDWNENALKKAQTYAETMSMSDSGIYDQLISEYGEKFTPKEAQYAIDNLE